MKSIQGEQVYNDIFLKWIWIYMVPLNLFNYFSVWIYNHLMNLCSSSSKCMTNIIFYHEWKYPIYSKYLFHTYTNSSLFVISSLTQIRRHMTGALTNPKGWLLKRLGLHDWLCKTTAPYFVFNLVMIGAFFGLFGLFRAICGGWGQVQNLFWDLPM